MNAESDLRENKETKVVWNPVGPLVLAIIIASLISIGFPWIDPQTEFEYYPTLSEMSDGLRRHFLKAFIVSFAVIYFVRVARSYWQLKAGNPKRSIPPRDGESPDK